MTKITIDFGYIPQLLLQCKPAHKNVSIGTNELALANNAIKDVAPPRTLEQIHYLLELLAVTIDDLKANGYALTDALRHGAESLKLSHHPLRMLENAYRNA